MLLSVLNLTSVARAVKQINILGKSCREKKSRVGGREEMHVSTMWVCIVVVVVFSLKIGSLNCRVKFLCYML
jgi:hypothetical protein